MHARQTPSRRACTNGQDRRNKKILNFNFLLFSRELQLDLGDGAAPPRLGSDWSIVRPPIPHLAQHQHPVRLSTFRTTDEPDGAAHHWPVDLAPPQLPPHQGAAAASASAAAVPGSPRTRSSRSSRAADVRVFI